ncbi:hypothetical protein TMatcc_006099 [Talaromyces marneffei ATCC 18224]|uniref:SnoaL-like domain-containing protein n=2 Tax=Talaromyces marneffei TaxID=37727 RepID=B6QCL8_TALMQ|nr:uncharacterized protein EYB26_002929 [Talaromyces marneffei]EEA25672.1 hypothetical protein PMAA_067700 [Talaromyces marneffei ATCC 18224]KAE8554376.1 hypothetical protein EYB25_002915 [Talaromyces marneffei]QGA15272.1 hypothetical protein EYB26_002929 [Talaromyces marneffei]
MDTHYSIASARVDIHEGGKTVQITCTTLMKHFRAGEAFSNTPGANNGPIHDFRGLKEKDGMWKLNAWILEPKFAQETLILCPMCRRVAFDRLLEDFQRVPEDM